MNGKDPALLVYTKDILTSCDDWTDEEFGCYCRLLFSSHVNNGLHNDIKRLKRISDSIEENSAMVLDKFFEDTDGKLRNKRLEKERERRLEYSKSQKWNATKSVIIRRINDDPKLVEEFKNEVKSIKWKEIEIADFETILTDSLTKLQTKESTNTQAKDKPIGLKPSVKHIATETVTATEALNVNEKEVDDVVEIFNAQCSQLSRVTKISKQRKSAIESRLKESGMPSVQIAICKTAESNFLNGNNTNGWKASFDWLMKPSNFLKVIEGNYDNNEGTGTSKEKGNGFVKGAAEYLAANDPDWKNL